MPHRQLFQCMPPLTLHEVQVLLGLKVDVVRIGLFYTPAAGVEPGLLVSESGSRNHYLEDSDAEFLGVNPGS